ncbi:unnamed protein product, partial [Ixodes persulcatus]
MEATRLLDAGCLGRLGRPLPGPYSPFGTPIAPYSVPAYPPHHPHVPYSIEGILHGSHHPAHHGPLGLVVASSPGHAALVGSRSVLGHHRMTSVAPSGHQQHGPQQQHATGASRTSSAASHKSKKFERQGVSVENAPARAHQRASACPC